MVSKSKWLWLVVTLLALAGCVSAEKDTENTDVYEITNYVYRVVDNNAGVACWVYNGYQKGGIACLPISQTEIGQ